MRARQLIDGAAFGPEALKAIGAAFDAAWSEIADRYDEPHAIEAARLMLANAILAIAPEDSRDAAELKDMALRRLAFNRQASLEKK
jgi:hypothetical protein